MRKSHPGIALLILGTVILVGNVVGQSTFPNWMEFVAGYQLAIVYWAIGIGLVAYEKRRESLRLTAYEGGIIGATALVAVSVAYIAIPAVGTGLKTGTGLDLAFLTILMAIALFVISTDQWSPRSLSLLILALIAGFAYSVYLVEKTDTLLSGLVLVFYFGVVVLGTVFGLPLILAVKELNGTRETIDSSWE